MANLSYMPGERERERDDGFTLTRTNRVKETSIIK